MRYIVLLVIAFFAHSSHSKSSNELERLFAYYPARDAKVLANSDVHIKLTEFNGDPFKSEPTWLFPLLNKNGVYAFTREYEERTVADITTPAGKVDVFVVTGDGKARLYTDHGERKKTLQRIYECHADKVCFSYGWFSGSAYTDKWINGVLSYKEFSGSRSAHKEYYKNGLLSKEEWFIDGRLLIFKRREYTNPSEYDEYDTFYHKDGPMLTVTHYMDNKKHGKERFFDKDGLLDRETVYDNDLFVSSLLKRTWYKERDGKILYYFDAIQKIEDGVCVTRDLATGAELRSEAVLNGRCGGAWDRNSLMHK